MGLLENKEQRFLKSFVTVNNALESCLTFEQRITQAIATSGLNLQKINLQYSQRQESWEWIGYVVPNLSDWVSIWKEADIWHVSAITNRCGVLKLVHSDLGAALSELKLVSQTQPSEV